jgi:hypothetical protein
MQARRHKVQGSRYKDQVRIVVRNKKSLVSREIVITVLMLGQKLEFFFVSCGRFNNTSLVLSPVLMRDQH